MRAKVYFTLNVASVIFWVSWGRINANLATISFVMRTF